MKLMAAKQTRPPKILPWMARKAQVSNAHALMLWRQAVSEVSLRAVPGSERFHALALDRLLELMAAESLKKPVPRHALNFGFRAQARLWEASMSYWDYWEQLNQQTMRRWQLLFSK